MNIFPPVKALDCTNCASMKIKSEYKKLANDAYVAYMRGNFEESIINYNKAFFQARTLFRLPEVPVESVNYLVDACRNCAEYCVSHKPAEQYMEIAINELKLIILKPTDDNQFNEKVISLYLHLSKSLIGIFMHKKEHKKVGEVENDIEVIWSTYSSGHVVFH